MTIRMLDLFLGSDFQGDCWTGKWNMKAIDVIIPVLKYWRFQRNFPLVVTEYANKDIVAVDFESRNGALNVRKIVECEVKVSKADLIRDAKKDKHAKNNCLNVTQFYFAVPSDMTSFTIDFASNLNPNYGVISVNSVKGISIPPMIAKSAKAMPINDPSWCVDSICSRLTSENINFWINKNVGFDMNPATPPPVDVKKTVNINDKEV